MLGNRGEGSVGDYTCLVPVRLSGIRAAQQLSSLGLLSYQPSDHVILAVAVEYTRSACNYSCNNVCMPICMYVYKYKCNCICSFISIAFRPFVLSRM